MGQQITVTLIFDQWDGNGEPYRERREVKVNADYWETIPDHAKAQYCGYLLAGELDLEFEVNR